jgi:hypothetical protein
MEKNLCRHCAQKTITLLDLSIDSDKQLQFLADLLIMQNQDGMLVEIGYALDKYLQKKLIREHVFLARDLNKCTLSQHEIKAELYRLKNHLNTALQ